MTAAIKVAETRAGSRIVAIGSYLPRRVVTNAEMCAMIDSTDEWIQQRTGIKERRWAGDDEQVQDMAYGAATQALSRAGMTAADIDCVIVATVSLGVRIFSPGRGVLAAVNRTGIWAIRITLQLKQGESSSTDTAVGSSEQGRS